MRLTLRLLLLLLLASLVWASWHRPKTPAPTHNHIRVPVPLAGSGNADEASGWRIVTRKLVWKEAAQSMQKRLQKAGLEVIPITRRETVELYAFDDPHTFASRQAAARVESAWRKHGIDAEIIKLDDHYGVALGRFFLPEHAERQRQSLEKSGMKYRYEKRTIKIPVYRFTFPPTSHSEAQKRWKRLEDMGIADPAMIREDRFTSLYGPLPKKGS